MSAARSLREALDRGMVVAPGAHDCLSARLIERAGFEAVYMTGFGATASRAGTPDLGLLGMSEMLTHARDMVRSVTLPVIADADTGYGGPSNIHRTVREHVQAGVAAIHLEDQVAPKRCGQMAGIRLMPQEEAARRLRCALEARGADPLIIIARTDGLAEGMDEALNRARAYQDCGVDLLFVDGVKTRHEVEAIAAGLDAPTVISLVDGTDAAALTHDDLRELGFALVLHAVSGLFAVTRTLADVFAELRESGTTAGAAGRMVSYETFCEVVDLAFHQDLDNRFG